MTPRREIIATLLEWYEDLLNGWQDGTAQEAFGFPRPNAILSQPCYQELERQLVLMRRRQPETYWMLVQRYLYAPRVQVMRCSGCVRIPKDRLRAMVELGLRHPKDEVQGAFSAERRYHTHGHKPVALQPAQVRTNFAVRPELVLAGIASMDDAWHGEPYLPNFEARVA